MKKNTLLYLDEEIVRKAKNTGLNISKICEEAIKGHLFPYLSLGEKISMDFEGYLKDLENEKKCFFLPVELEEVKLKNIGPCQEKNLKLGKFNVISGGNASGKTTLIRSIAYFFGYRLDEENIVSHGSKEGGISLKIKAPREIKAEFGRKRTEKTCGCVLIDDGGERLTDQQFGKFVDYLKGLGKQVLLTTHKENFGKKKMKEMDKKTLIQTFSFPLG